MTVAALHRLLDEIDTQGGPEAARQWALSLPDPTPESAAVRAWAQQAGLDCPSYGPIPGRVMTAWRNAITPPKEGPEPMAQSVPRLDSIPDLPVPNARPVGEPQPLPIGQLLKWGDEHPDPNVRDQAARARAVLTGLRRRHAADQELTAITTEAEQLEKRLAELRAREAELAPAKPKTKRKSPEYSATEVRAWAEKNGVDCPAAGRVPKKVVDAWREATGQTGAGS
ncbi:Lsr2 family protein [Streptomyces sp. M2CJ-2]|uniref:Lsr2 family DNA-binding protein n=1 Tax=Streptomyces sp. M2CJ-2 TaxID=2803948 RepID=UPI001925294A|nr:histone-like nucleoid-structuring protein Lsr2 [Streptomyces sp. M2CJ-2]MBL3669090.1 Lsr2 family protein [Streptomyces sp. M2CJ-2]